MSQPKLVLAGIPARLDLLAQIGIRPDLVSVADLDETPKRVNCQPVMSPPCDRESKGGSHAYG